MTKKGQVTKKLQELWFKSRRCWSAKATRSRGEGLGECGEGEKEEGWCFEFDKLGDRRVVDEKSRNVVVIGVKTVVADKETCLLSKQPVKWVEDGRRGEGGRGV